MLLLYFLDVLQKYEDKNTIPLDWCEKNYCATNKDLPSFYTTANNSDPTILFIIIALVATTYLIYILNKLTTWIIQSKIH